MAPCLLFGMWEYTRFCCWVVCAFPGGKRSFTLTQQSAAFEYAIHKCFMKVHECYFLKGTACHGVYLPHSNIIRVLRSTRRVFLTHLWLSFLQDDDRVIVESLKSYAGSEGMSINTRINEFTLQFWPINCKTSRYEKIVGAKGTSCNSLGLRSSWCWDNVSCCLRPGLGKWHTIHRSAKNFLLFPLQFLTGGCPYQI